MAAPTIYKWTDASAPQIRRGNMPDLLALFQAVFVNGYGTQSPAGWTIPYSDATSFVLKQGGAESVKACLKLHTIYSNGGYCQMEAAEDYTDLNTPVNQFAGIYANDRFCLGYANDTSKHIPWMIFATARSAYFLFGYNAQQLDISTFDTAYTSSASYTFQNFFGDYKKYDATYDYNQMAVYGAYSATTLQYWAYGLTYPEMNTVGSYGKGRALGSPGGTLGENVCYKMTLREAGINSWYLGHEYNGPQYAAYPNPRDGSLYLDKVRIMIDRAIMGELPGLFYSPQSRPFPFTGSINTFAGTGDYAGQTMYIIPSYSGQTYITDGDWGVN